MGRGCSSSSSSNGTPKSLPCCEWCDVVRARTGGGASEGDVDRGLLPGSGASVSGRGEDDAEDAVPTDCPERLLGPFEDDMLVVLPLPLANGMSTGSDGSAPGARNSPPSLFATFLCCTAARTSA